MQGKTAEIICVGTELLMGSTLNTNATEIAAALAGIGLNLYHTHQKRTQLRYFVAKWHSCDSLFSVQFTAQLIAYRLPAFFVLLHKCHVLGAASI